MKHTFDKQLQLFRSLIREGFKKGVVKRADGFMIFSLAEVLHSCMIVDIATGLKPGHNIGNPVYLRRALLPIHGVDFRDIVKYLKSQDLIEVGTTPTTGMFKSVHPMHEFDAPVYGAEEFAESLGEYIGTEFRVREGFMNLVFPMFNTQHAQDNGFSPVTIKGLQEANSINESELDLYISLHGLIRFLITQMLIDLCNMSGIPIKQSTKGKVSSNVQSYYDRLSKQKVKLPFTRDTLDTAYSYLSDVMSMVGTNSSVFRLSAKCILFAQVLFKHEITPR